MLFIGPFVFLINNNKTQLRLGGKNGTPGTDNDVKFSVSYSLPLIKLFSQRQFTVEDSHLMGKA